MDNSRENDLATTILIVCVGLLLGYISTTGTKSQWIRLVDIFIIGPLMIILGYQQYTRTHQWLNILLIFFGATTITYNLRNYLSSK